MKILNRTYVIGLSLLASSFWACQDEVVKSDYESSFNPAVSIVASYSATEVGANFVVIEGSCGQQEFSEAVLVISSNENLSGAKKFALEDDSVFSYRVSGLVPSTDYYFAVIEADSLMIRALGEKKTFTTEDGVIAFSVDNASTSQSAWNSAGFSVLDKDGDGYNWALVPFPANSTTYAYRSQSWSGTALTPENYLLFPAIDYNGTDGSLAFEIRATNAEWYAETVKLVISDEPLTIENCRDAEVLLSHTLASPASYFANVDVPSMYEEKMVYFALVHTDVSDNDAIVLLGATFIFK